MDIKYYIQNKKDLFIDKARKIAVTGLATATVLTGAAALSSCDRNTPADPTSNYETVDLSGASSAIECKSAIEDYYKAQNEKFEVDEIYISKTEMLDIVSYAMHLSDYDENNTDVNFKFASADFTNTEDLFNSIYSLINQDNSSIKIVYNETFNHTAIILDKNALVDDNNAEILKLIYNEIISNNNQYFWFDENQQIQ